MKQILQNDSKTHFGRPQQLGEPHFLCIFWWINDYLIRSNGVVQLGGGFKGYRTTMTRVYRG